MQPLSMPRASWMKWIVPALALAVVLAAPVGARRADAPAGAPAQAPSLDPALLAGVSFRHLSVFARGGRSTAVAGVPSNDQLYYMGSTGGGVWRTTDAGQTWTNVSDGFFEAGSIGAIAVSESNPNVIYVGTGSACPRGNISPGVGLYKSADAGKTWQHVGLRDSRTIGRIVVHPANPDVAYVAALGNLFAPNSERGVYRTRDGGRTWDRVHFVSDRTGAVDLSMDMKNPDVLFAAMWTVQRQPWSIDSGSAEAGLFRSTDGGATWQKLGGGLPAKTMVGRIGVSVSRANPKRVYAIVEAGDNQGGVFRSDDGGTTWTRTYTSRNLLQRAFYYIHIAADPVDENTVYGLNVSPFKSTDGGKTFGPAGISSHSDYHDIWINPLNPRAIIVGNDGGGAISVNGSAWSGQNNQPTSEIYRVTADTRVPYWVYGAQQDNSTVAVPSQGTEATYGVGGGESGWIAVDPRDYNVIYAGNYGGSISRMDRKFGVSDQVRVYADLQTGQRAADMKFRFQWNAPIKISMHTPDVVYTTSQYVHKTTNGGLDWAVASPDLTRNDKRRQGYSGGEGITRDSTGVEVYSTIFALEESPTTPGLIWAGSDDGLIHITRDNGKTWTNVTPPGLPEGTVNMIDPSVHDPGRAVFALHRYRMGDFTPYLYLTSDYGKSWKRIADGTNGIPRDHFTRVVREDTSRKGLFFAGTEFGLYASWNDGETWLPFQLNLPRTPVTDLMIHRDDLIVSTQGRGFYILDNLSVPRGLRPGGQTPAAILHKPEDAYRSGGQAPTFYYWFREQPAAPVTVEVSDPSGRVVFTTTAQPGTAPAALPGIGGAGGGRGGRGGGGGGAGAAGGAAGPGAAAGRGGAAAAPPPAGAPPPPVAGAGAAAAGTAPAGQRGGGGGRGGFAGGGGGGGAASAVQGLNWATWTSLRYPAPYMVPPGIVLWGGGGGQGPKMAPGTYTVKVSSGAWTETQTFRLRTDPLYRPEMTPEEGAVQLRMANEIGALLKDLYDNLARIRDVKRQAAESTAKLKPNSPAVAAARTLKDKLEAVEADMTQMQGEGGQDALNFPGRTDNQLIALYGAIIGPERRMGSPVLERYKDLKPEADKLQQRWVEALKTEVDAFNAVAAKAKVAAIVVR